MQNKIRKQILERFFDELKGLIKALSNVLRLKPRSWTKPPSRSPEGPAGSAPSGLR